MKSYLNISIDGTEYGTKWARQPKPTGVPALTGMPGGAASAAPLGEEQKKKATERYEQGVFDVLLQIAHRQSGRAVIGEIRRLGRRVTIVPYFPPDAEWWGASATPTDVAAATRKHRLDRDMEGEATADRKRGTGKGSDSVIEFITPDLARGLEKPPAIATTRVEKHDPNILHLADEILVHEMVHATRHMAGMRARRRVPGQKHYDNLEEFYAVVVTNVYRSEWMRPGLRYGHGADFPVTATDSRQFVRIALNRLHLRRFCRQQPAFAKELSDTIAVFNPFKHVDT